MKCCQVFETKYANSKYRYHAGKGFVLPEMMAACGSCCMSPLLSYCKTNRQKYDMLFGIHIRPVIVHCHNPLGGHFVMSKASMSRQDQIKFSSKSSSILRLQPVVTVQQHPAAVITTLQIGINVEINYFDCLLTCCHSSSHSSHTTSIMQRNQELLLSVTKRARMVF